MTKEKIPLWKSAFFWNKLADVLGLIGTGSLVTLDQNNASHTWTWVVGGATASVQLIRLLFNDANHNNIPDILEDQEADVQQEVNVVVKQNAGGTPTVEVTQQTVTTKPDASV